MGGLSIAKFIADTDRLDLKDMISAITSELRRATMGKQAGRYREQLLGLRHILQTGERPSNLENFKTDQLRPVVERLITANNLKSSAINIFVN